MKTLGIDYGLRKIGLAISEGELASPLRIEKNTKNFAKNMNNFCQNEGIEKIIVGVSEGKMAEIQKNFGKELARTCALPVEFWDETLTSKMAVRKMIEAGRKRSRRKQEDAVSAALILQTYLDAQRSK